MSQSDLAAPDPTTAVEHYLAKARSSLPDAAAPDPTGAVDRYLDDARSWLPDATAPDPTCAVDRYLAEVRSRLPGSRGHRSVILAELRSGLLDAADARATAGLPFADAAQAAIEEFGDPALVAQGFKAEVAARMARRVALTMLVTGPLVGLLWVGTAAASHLIPHGQVAGLQTGIQAIGVLVAIAACATAACALLSVAATGRLTRWLEDRPGRAPAAAAAAGFSAVGADALGLALLAVELARAPANLSPKWAIIAAAASIIRLTIARRAARRCLAIRAELS